MIRARHLLLFLGFVAVSLVSLTPLGVGQTSFTTLTSTSTSTSSVTVNLTSSLYSTYTTLTMLTQPSNPSGTPSPVMLLYMIAAIILIVATIMYTKRKPKKKERVHTPDAFGRRVEAAPAAVRTTTGGKVVRSIQHRPEPRLGTVTGTELCNRCGKPLRSTDSYCLNCGARRGK
jgi:hypothetical protein